MNRERFFLEVSLLQLITSHGCIQDFVQEGVKQPFTYSMGSDPLNVLLRYTIFLGVWGGAPPEKNFDLILNILRLNHCLKDLKRVT